MNWPKANLPDAIGSLGEPLAMRPPSSTNVMQQTPTDIQHSTPSPLTSTQVGPIYSFASGENTKCGSLTTFKTKQANCVCVCVCSRGCHLHVLFRGDGWIKSPFTNAGSKNEETENAGSKNEETENAGSNKAGSNNAGSKNENEGSKNAGSNEGGDEGGTWAWSPFST